MPINECDYYKAFTEEEAFDLLVEKAMQPAFEVLPCNCQPPCKTLNEDEKQILQKRVNERIAEIQLAMKMKAGMSLEDLCGFIAVYLKEKHNKDLTAEQVFNLSPTRSMAHYLDMYEEAVYNMRWDFFGRTALIYFEERVRATMNEPALKSLSARYQNVVATLEKEKI